MQVVDMFVEPEDTDFAAAEVSGVGAGLGPSSGVGQYGFS
jgi:hypothetical protein